jgi:hypothetical protein
MILLVTELKNYKYGDSLQLYDGVSKFTSIVGSNPT